MAGGPQCVSNFLHSVLLKKQHKTEEYYHIEAKISYKHN